MKPKTLVDKLTKEASSILRKGGLVVVPSDTVYGLSVDATSPNAVEKLIKFKSRPAGKPISVFVHSLQEANRVVTIDKKQKKTLQSILPGCFTIVLPSKHRLDSRLESEKGTLGIRIVDHPFIERLTATYPHPITATSANLSGTSPHYSIESLLKSLSEKKRKMIDLIIDYGKLPYNKPSTVIDLTGNEITILRQGGIRHPDFYRHSRYISHNEQETKQIAKDLIKKWVKNIKKKPLVIILQGELGTGKTQFVKGIGEYFGIKNIISPTFVIFYEYGLKHGFLYHVDLYNVTEKDEFAHLGFEDMLKPGNVICIEWGEKSGELSKLFAEKAAVKNVTVNYIDQNRREILLKHSF